MVTLTFYALISNSIFFNKTNALMPSFSYFYEYNSSIIWRLERFNSFFLYTSYPFILLYLV